MEKFNVIIVGAGPIGLYTTRLLEEKGLSVSVFEEHKKIGYPIQCSGLISSNLGGLLEIDKEWVEHTVKGALFHFPGGTLRAEKKGIGAYVIDRGKFDSSLSKGLKSKIFSESRVDSLEVSDKVVISSKGKKYSSELIIGCDGPNSVVRNYFGITPPELTSGIISIEEKKDSSEFVEMWYDKSVCPDGFLWKIPRGKTTEYGMLSRRPDYSILEKFFPLSKNYKKTAGIIPMGLQKTSFERALLIGDAAAQIKPWSGGGVIYGLTAARIAAEVIGKAFSENNFSEEFLKEYDTLWKEKLGKNITLGMMFRHFFENSPESQVVEFFSKLTSFSGFNDLDMDFPLAGIL